MHTTKVIKINATHAMQRQELNLCSNFTQPTQHTFDLSHHNALLHVVYISKTVVMASVMDVLKTRHSENQGCLFLSSSGTSVLQRFLTVFY